MVMPASLASMRRCCRLLHLWPLQQAVQRRPFATQPPKTILLVYHSRTGAAREMADHLELGALAVAEQMDMNGELRVNRKEARDAGIDDMLQASGYIFCAPENLASLSGEMKEFVDRVYYGAFETTCAPDDPTTYSEESRLVGRPFAVAISAGSDGAGAARQLERICQGWRLRSVAETMVHQNGLPQTKENILAPKPPLPKETRGQCADLGGRVAATLLL